MIGKPFCSDCYEGQITQLRAERDQMARGMEAWEKIANMKHGDAARDMRERCAKEADRLDRVNFEMPPRIVAGYIRALPDTPAVIATDGGANGEA